MATKNICYLSLKDKQRDIQLQKHKNRNQHKNLHRHAKNEQNPFISSKDMNVKRLSLPGLD